MKRTFLTAALAASIVAAPVAQQAPDRGGPPRIGPVPALKLPAIQKRQLSNGIPVWIVEMHGVPIAQVNLVVQSGSYADPPGKFGLANLTAAMLEEGAGSRSALELADAIDFLGASLDATSSSDAMAVRLQVPVARLSDALAIMADVALRPTFPPQELERLRTERLTTIIQSRDDPETVAQLGFARALFGASHRYGTAQMGTAQTVQAFTVDDLRSFYTANFRPDNAAVIAVGDITPDRVVPLLDTSFGAWPGRGATTAKPSPPAAPAQAASRQVLIVDKADAPQSQIRIGGIGVPRSTPDYFPIQVMNTILGGSFVSRLNLNLREKNGYAYGASSFFDMRLSAGPVIAAAGVQTDKTADALKEFFNELNGIRQPVPADELARAKNYVALRFPSTFEAIAQVSQRLEEVLVHKLPDDYFARYVQNIEAVTAADVRRVAEQYVLPARFTVLVVGDRKTIEPGIRALNLGPIKAMTIDEVFGPAPSVR